MSVIQSSHGSNGLIVLRNKHERSPEKCVIDVNQALCGKYRRTFIGQHHNRTLCPHFSTPGQYRTACMQIELRRLHRATVVAYIVFTAP